MFAAGAQFIPLGEVPARPAELASALERERANPHRLADLAVDGADLIAAGIPEGPEIGRILGVLLAEVVEDPDRNDRASLLARARREMA